MQGRVVPLPCFVSRLIPSLPTSLRTGDLSQGPAFCRPASHHLLGPRSLRERDPLPVLLFLLFFGPVTRVRWHKTGKACWIGQSYFSCDQTCTTLPLPFCKRLCWHEGQEEAERGDGGNRDKGEMGRTGRLHVTAVRHDTGCKPLPS